MGVVVDLIRHAESELNRDRSRVGGRAPWCEINALGREQSRALGRRLAGEGVRWARVCSSTAVRTQQTARYCLEAMGESPWRIEPSSALLEQHMGAFEGQPRAAVYTPEVLAAVSPNPWGWAPPGGESQAECGARLRAWLEREVVGWEADGAARVAVFTHGLAIRCLLTDLFGLDTLAVMKLAVENTSITTLVHAHDGWAIMRQNDARHLADEGLEVLDSVHAPQAVQAQVREGVRDEEGER